MIVEVKTRWKFEPQFDKACKITKPPVLQYLIGDEWIDIVTDEDHKAAISQIRGENT